MSGKRDRYKKSFKKKEDFQVNSNREELNEPPIQPQNNWSKFFVILSILLIVIWIFGGNYHLIFFIGWAVLTIIVIACYLLKYHIFDGTRMFFILYAMLCLKIALSPEDSIRQCETFDIETVGHFVKKENNCFYYEIKSKIYEFPVSESLYLNETDEFVKVREYALLRLETKEIVSFDADEDVFRSNIFYGLKKHYATDIFVSDSYYFAKNYPADYYKQFGLKVVYRANIVELNNTAIIVGYQDEYNQKQQTKIYIKNNYKLGDNLLISKNIDIEKDRNFQVVVDSKDYCNYQYMDYFGFHFSDTIVSYKSLFNDVPQLKKMLLNDYKTDLYRFGNARVAFYLNTCETSDGDEYPVYFYYNFNGALDTMMVNNQLNNKSQGLGNALLIDYPSKRILKSNLTQIEINKYKYPVQYDAGGNEIGNNTFSYARYSPNIYNQHFKPKKCYLTKIKSIESKNCLYSNVKVILTHSTGKSEVVECTLPITDEIQFAILVQDENGYRSVDKKFYTEQYYNKLKEEAGFIFNDTIVTQNELLQSIPSMEGYIKKIE